jgi:hypothetical protein
MKKIYLLFFLALMAMQFNALAERINVPGLNIPKLIITEVRPDARASAYVEITNMGDTAIDLEPFTLHSVFYNTRCTEYSDSAISFNRLNEAVNSQIGKIHLKGILQPGESFVVANVWDQNDARGSGIPNHNTAIAMKGNQFAHLEEALNLNGWINKPEWQTYGRDSVSTGIHEFLHAEATAGYLIHWVYQVDSITTDSTYIDNFNHFWYPDENNAIGFNVSSKGPWIFPIGGVEDAMTNNVMVRKSNVTVGNLNWNQSRGTDASTSEWLVIPKNWSTNMAFNSVGVHGNFDLDFSVKDPSKIIVDDRTISVPWELVRGDSIIRHFNLGDGMTWGYDMVGVFEDSASYIVRPGDKFGLYAVGTRVNKMEFTLQVREPEPDVAMVFPRRRLLIDEEIVVDEVTGISDTVITRYWSNGFVYELADGPSIDSIINVPFATRTDSLLKYLDKPEKATWEFVFVNGNKRVDLQFGDKLKVTSEDGSNSKEYFVAVSEHVQNNNALLSAVTWPDIDKNLYPRWNKGDTLPEFTPLKTSYLVELRFDAKQIPAFQFIPQDLRSKIEVVNATNINGNAEQRTTSVTVTSESDTISNTYHFVFQKQGVPVQPYLAEPFISEYVHGITTQGWAVEIYNPGTEDLDLSRYMYVAGALSQTWQEAVETCVTSRYWAGNPNDGIMIYQTHYVPSKRWRNDMSEADWMAMPNEENPFAGPGFLRDDNQTDPWVKGGDVFVMGVGTSTNAQQTKIRAESDFIFRGTPADGTLFAWDSTKILHRETPIWNNPGHNMWLLKILNDSILDGTKDVRDHTAYELIDRWEIIGDSLAGRANVRGMNWNMRRKSSVIKGNLERMGGAAETAESSEWEIHNSNDFDWNNNSAVANLGIHSMDPVTTYLSTVTSVKLIVTPGYRGDNLSITGNITDYTPATIALVLDKADDSQTFKFMRGDMELADGESLADADMLVVTSGDSVNVTNYKLINAPLDNNTMLTAVDGSGLIISGDVISGIPSGATLKDVLANLMAGDKAIVNVLDANGALQPLAVTGLDSMLNDVLVSDQVYLQVVAENDDKMIYSFDLGIASSDAILWSNILHIDQESKLIQEFPVNLTSPGFLELVYANEGATVSIMDKGGFEREMGFMSIDDRIVVTAADGVTKVIYRFSEDLTVSVKRSVESLTDVVIFPNPVTNILNIKGFELAAVQVYSISGTMMISETASYSNRLDVSNLPDGIYIIKMTDVKGRVAIDKFLKR